METVRISFNGAASMKMRKGKVRWDGNVAVCWLQWGRINEDAEGVRGLTWRPTPMGLQWGRINEDAEGSIGKTSSRT